MVLVQNKYMYTFSTFSADTKLKFIKIFGIIFFSVVFSYTIFLKNEASECKQLI